MGRVGSCFDNAAAVALFSTLEWELLSRDHSIPRTRQSRSASIHWPQSVRLEPALSSGMTTSCCTAVRSGAVKLVGGRRDRLSHDRRQDDESGEQRPVRATTDSRGLFVRPAQPSQTAPGCRCKSGRANHSQSRDRDCPGLTSAA